MEDFRIIYQEEIEISEEEKEKLAREYQIDAEYGIGGEDDVND